MRKWAVPLLLYLTLAVSIALSPWWNPWSYSLSALGSASNGLGGAVFDGGLALTGLSLTHLHVPKFETYVLLLGILAALVGAINIDFGMIHFLVSLLLFLTLYAYVLAHGTIEAYALALPSIGLWAAHFVAGIPPGVAIPELVAIVIGLYFLMKDSR